VEDSLGHDLIISLYIQLSVFSDIQNVQYRNNKIQLSASRQEMNKVPSLEGKFVIRVFSKDFVM
jgi:hypothetical protein